MADIVKESYRFRRAIEDAKNAGAFDLKDRMHLFPRGCCDDTCDLFGYYLEEKGIHTMQLIKVYKPYEPEVRCNHAVLLLDDKVIIDLTGDQFFRQPVYVGEEDDFYLSLEFREIYENYDIRKDDRLWGDYNKILSFLK